MADPKYANLPGIAHDQPDLYETDELPECDHYQSDVEDNSDSVETLHIAASEAFGKFRGKNLSGKVDFSGRIPGNNTQERVISHGDYELAGTGSGQKGVETPLQKYQRLNCEVKELLEELDLAKTQAKQDAGTEKHAQSLVGVATQTTQLQDQLSNLKLEEMLGSGLVKQLKDPQRAANEKLMTQLKAIGEASPAAVTGKNESKNVSDDNSKVMYELMMKPNVASFEDHVQIAEVEKRIASIEKLIAASPEKMSTLAIETNQKHISGSVGVLDSRLSLLNPTHLDHVEGRLSALLQKMNTAADQKHTIEDADKQVKVDELYDLCVKGEANAVVLPDIVDRLDALQSLHGSALQFTKTISQLDSVQQKLEHNLSGNGAMLKDTQTKFQENLSNIQRNFDNLEQRINALKQHKG